jgi:adenylosuccinate synthase
LPRLKLCTAYKINGQVIKYFPASIATLEKCQPVYEEIPGWETPTGSVRFFKELPVKAQKYVRKLEEILNCPACLISVGPRREQTIVRKSIF